MSEPDLNYGLWVTLICSLILTNIPSGTGHVCWSRGYTGIFPTFLLDFAVNQKKKKNFIRT